MTIFFPDISDIGDAGLQLQPQTVAVIAKASEGTNFRDPSYQTFLGQARAVGAHFSAYHWLWPGNAAAQAANCYAMVGPDVPVMIDHEETSVTVTVQDAVDFVHAYRALGGVVSRTYLPHWYWLGHMGMADLTPLRDLGLLLVASDYSRAYDDNAWPVPYGGYDSVFQWQYTDRFGYGGRLVDFNAVKLTLPEYIAAVGVAPLPVPPPPTPKDFTLTNWTSVRKGDNGGLVWQAQGLLLANGLSVGSASGKPDGQFGPTTDASTRELQRRYGIVVDGVFGPHTASVALYHRDLA